MKLDALKAKLDKKEIVDLPITEKELCDRYEQLYTGAVNDVLRERTLLDQALPCNIMPLKMEMKVAGIAYTIRSNPDPTVTGEMEIRADMLDDMPRECIVIWDAGDESEASHWGEVMTASAIARGSRGAVVNGGLRDTMQVLDQNYPVFNKYRTSNGSLGRTKITGYNIPLRIGKAYIYPGDLIFGDIDGVLVVPREMAYEVLVRAEEIKATEQEMKTWVHEGFSAKNIVKKGGYF
ncbi:RraA family protein [Chondrinema litorale]|uniref:RraA family protein n=1 Tax=Chondrinema litorale TaxID=2994555 RepID=UPI00254331E5|nr:RraA family protein [Chondrinema litorale]UZR99557.1 RraA family protein [Chondrinema litorale]